MLGKNLSEKQLTQLFMRIDTNSDGSVDWDEFMNFLILENENASLMREEQCEYVNPRVNDPINTTKQTSHSDMITNLLMAKEHSEGQRYFTSSKDGTVKVWNASSLTPVSTISVGNSWVTNLAYLSKYDIIAAASSDRSISFFDLKKSNEIISNPVSKVGSLKGVPMTMDYLKDYDMMVVGDSEGSLHMYKFKDENWHVCNTTMNCHKKELLKIQNRQLAKYENKILKKDFSLRGVKLQTHKQHNLDICEVYNDEVTKGKLHSSWLTKAEYIPDTDTLFTCSTDKTVKQIDIERQTARYTFNHHKKGVYSFVWCSDFKFLASCGEERHITLWNPFSRQSSVSYLIGHSSAVLDIALNRERFQLISLGADKVVKVWDIRNYKCIQTIYDKTTYRPENRSTGVYFNPKVNSILLTSKKINVWPFKIQEQLMTSHEYNVTGAMYNKYFECIISADEKSNVHVWDIKENKLSFRFGEAHGRNRITAMALDTSKRRLITGGHDGSIKMWNFNNGQCLREFNYDEEPEEVSALLFIGDLDTAKLQYIVSAGWDKKIYVWPDENEDVVSWIKSMPKSEQKGHSDDILSMAYCYRENLVATGGHLGEVITWHFETGFAKAYLHKIDPTLLPQAGHQNKSVEALLYSRSLENLLSVSSDTCLRFWDLKNNELVGKTMLEHQEGELITTAHLSEEENYLVTGDESGNVKVWTIKKPRVVEPLCFFEAFTDSITSLDIFNQEDLPFTYVIATAYDKNVKIFTTTGKYCGFLGSGKRLNLESTSGEAKAPKKPQQFLKTSQKKDTSLPMIDNSKNSKVASEFEGNKAADTNKVLRKFRIKEQIERMKYDTTTSDIFRGMNIDKYKVDHLPNNLEEQINSLDLPHIRHLISDNSQNYSKNLNRKSRLLTPNTSKF